MVLLLVLNLLLLVVSCVGARTTVIAVCTPSCSDVDSQCINGSDYQYRINDLPQVNINNTQIRICSSQIALSENISFSQVSNVTIVGYEYPQITCQNHSESGLNFVQVMNLELINFSVINCGFEVKIDPDQSNIISHNIHASINIQQCTNVKMTNISITNAPGSGLSLFYNHRLVEVLYSTFQGSGQDRLSGGNGIYIETSENDSVTTLINNCNFIGNIANTGNDKKIIGFSRFDKGGGLCVYVRDSTNTYVIVQDCLFQDNVGAQYGGGLYGNFYGKPKNGTFNITNCHFVRNSAKFGGANYVGYLHNQEPIPQTPLNCSYIFSSNYFESNSAAFGGGVSLFSTKTAYSDLNAKVTFDNCTWKHNSGQYGSAIAVLPNAWNLYSDGYLPVPSFTDCTFDSNYIMYKNIYRHVGSFKQYSKGAGAFYCSSHKIVFRNNTKFINNNGTALHVASSIVLFLDFSNVEFKNNMGYSGGAIHQLSSVLYISNSGRFLFENNSAYNKGGAIYQYTSEMHIFDYSKTCFLDYIDLEEDVSKRNISVAFINNMAGTGNSLTGYGHSVYASSLLPCNIRFSFSTADPSIDIFSHVGNFTYYPPGRQWEISTAVNHSDISELGEIIKFIPGKETQLPFVDHDDLNQTIRSEYLVTISQDNASIETNQIYSEILNKTLLLYGSINTTATVTLSTTKSRQTALTFTAEMQPCPPGFIQQIRKDSHPGACICSVNTEREYSGIVGCNLTLMQAYRNRNFWIGYDSERTESEESLISGQCPFGFCSDNRLLPPTANRTSLSEVVCSASRTGILCGKCKTNLSIHYHSHTFKCKTDRFCKWGWLFFILSEVLPVTIIFLVIIFFNISFTSGTLNGFIFYAQVVEIFHTTAGDLLPTCISNPAQIVSRLLSFFYLSFNLKTFVLDEVSFCLWKDANVLDILAFNYIILLYAFILIITVVIVMNKCNFRSILRRIKPYKPLKPWPNFRYSIIHGLSAFLVLCYVQCARVSIALLKFERLSGSKASVIFYDGDITWMSVNHLPYAIPAFLMGLILVVTPPILLLIYPFHYKIFLALHIEESRCIKTLFNPLERLKPLLDSFQGCFKDQYRFFSGLYFVYRFLIIAIEWGDPLLGEIQLIFMLLLNAICQPYKKRLHNIIDILLFGNLAIINAITMSTFNTMSSIKMNSTLFTWIQLVLISLPLLIMIACLTGKAVLKCKAMFRSKAGNLSETESFEYPARLMYGSN